MKFIKHIISAAALVFAVASCSVISEDAFSTAPVAPELEAHAGILMTKNTMDENVVFTWSAARFFEHNGYTLYAAYGESEKAIATTGKDELVYKVSKTEFKEMLYEIFPELPANTSFDLAFKVGAKNLEDGKEYVSAPASINIYAYGDAIVSVVSVKESSYILNKETPTEELELIEWTPAILEYNQAVTYNVLLSVGNGEPVKLAEGLDGTSYNMTVDALNEAVVAAGGVEDAENEVAFTVVAVCQDIPAGVSSAPATTMVKTYIATFPDAMWLPGNYQGWNPATAPVLTQSSKTKGLYQGFVDLTTEDGKNAEFKFSAAPSWSNVDFGFKEIDEKEYGSDIPYVALTSSVVSADNIVAPPGMYFIQLDKKLGKLTMVQVVNLEIIGDFNSWSSGVAMEWNADGKYWISSDAIEMSKEGGFKFRFNSDWTFSFGGSLDNVAFGAGNIPFSSTGTYKISLKAETSDFSVNAIDVNMPDFLVMPGSFGSWDPYVAMKVFLVNKDAGIYKGYATMYNGTGDDVEFKFVKNYDTWYGGESTGENGYTLGDGANLKIKEGSYYWEVNLFAMTANAILVSPSVIGDFSGWGDIPMIFDEKTGTYSCEVKGIEAGNKFKFRFNGTWDYNLGGDSRFNYPDSQFDNILIHDGKDIVLKEGGDYTFVLDMANLGGRTAPFVTWTKTN